LPGGELWCANLCCVIPDDRPAAFSIHVDDRRLQVSGGEHEVLGTCGFATFHRADGELGCVEALEEAQIGMPCRFGAGKSDDGSLAPRLEKIETARISVWPGDICGR
jgi:hypothetical protein